MLLASGAFEDNTACHIMSGLGAGFVAVCVGSPVDVVKSRVMGDKAGKYSGMMNCFAKTFAEEVRRKPRTDLVIREKARARSRLLHE